jgi:predicted metalloprotease with PDZ domain
LTGKAPLGGACRKNLRGKLMRLRRTITGIALASMLTAQLVPAVAHAENPMGYRVLSVEQASRLPNKHGALGVDVAAAQRISDPSMTFALMQVKGVQRGSTAAQAGLQKGDQIIAVNGRVFPNATAFAAYVRSMAPGSRINIDYIPAGGGPRNAERVAVVIGKPGSNAAQHAQAQEQSSGMSTRTKIGLGAAALLGCYYFGCFSGGSGSSSR